MLKLVQVRIGDVNLGFTSVENQLRRKKKKKKEVDEKESVENSRDLGICLYAKENGIDLTFYCEGKLHLRVTIYYILIRYHVNLQVNGL